MQKLFYKIGAVVISAILISGCSSKKEETTTAAEEKHDPNLVEFTQEQYRSVGVELGYVNNINLSNYVKASGSIDVPPKDLISITSPYGGTIRSTDVIEGRYVGKGQVIATIENPEFIQVQQDYLESSSQLAYLKQNLTRQQQLVEENIAARKSLQQAQSEYNAMSGRIAGLKAKLRMLNINPASLTHDNLTSRANIYAPSSGYITHVYSNVGKYVGANDVLADMANTSNILVKIKVFEKDLPQVKIGQRIRFKAPGDSIERIAVVYLTGKDIDADRTVEVHGKIMNPSSFLLPGMFINAIMEIGSAQMPALPQTAIVQSGGKNYIFITEDRAAAGNAAEKHHAFRRIEIGVGPTENGYTAVMLPEGFDVKSKVVTKGAYDLLSKMNNSEEEEE